MVPTEGGSPSWRQSVGRWGVGVVLRACCPSPRSWDLPWDVHVDRHLHIYTEAREVSRKKPVAHYLRKSAYRSDKLLQVAPSTEAEGDSAGFQLASRRL